MPSAAACALGRAFGNDDSGRTDTIHRFTDTVQ